MDTDDDSHHDGVMKNKRPVAATRATTYDEFTERMSSFASASAETYWRAFLPRVSDVIIAPFAKCGTTWLQQIVHGLRTGGDMSFDDISRVVPWIETAYQLDIDLGAEQRAEPRAFKSHLAWDDVPKGCRYIVSIRDPKDALVSMYRFMDGWFVEPGAISIDEFARRRSFDRETGPDYWRHLASWLSQRHDPNVLLLAFEDMKVNLPAVVDRIAAFIGIETNADLLRVATDQASFEFMQDNSAPFSDPMMRSLSEAVAGIPPNSDSAKVREGTVGAHHAEMSPGVIATFDRIWDETITAEFGYASYAELVADLTANR